MASERTVGELRIVVIRPAERVQHRTEEQRGIGHAPGDDHIGAGGEAPRHHIGAEIGIGRCHARQQQFQWRAVFHQRQFGMRAHHVGDFIARHHGAGIVRTAPLRRMFAHGARSTHRIGGAHVGDDLDATSQRRRHDRFHALQQHGRVALGRDPWRDPASRARWCARRGIPWRDNRVRRARRSPRQAGCGRRQSRHRSLYGFGHVPWNQPARFWPLRAAATAEKPQFGVMPIRRHELCLALILSSLMHGHSGTSGFRCVYRTLSRLSC